MSNRSSRPPVSVGNRAVSVLLGGQALLGVAAAWAEVPPPVTQPPSSAKPAGDAAGQASLTAFLRDYHQALATGNRSFLAAHTHLPLPVSELHYDMEAQIKPGQLASIGELLKGRQRLRWPATLVPKSAEELSRLRRGTEQCLDPKHPSLPDFSQGEPAVELHGDTATLTYLAEPCSAETHLVTLHFARSGSSWQLRERSARRPRG
jgi:hypothetical protein